MRIFSNVAKMIAVFAVSLHCQSWAATTAFTYNFEGMTNGELALRDGWSPYLSYWNDCIVTNGPAGSVNTTKVLKGQATSNAVGVFRLLPRPVLLGSANPNAVVKYHAYGADSSAYCTVGPLINGNLLPVTGFGVSNGQLRTTLRQGNGVNYYGDALTTQHWYEVKVVMDFSTNVTSRGTATLSYRDLTTGQVSFTTDSTFTDFPLLSSTHTSGNYWIDSFFCRLANTSTNYQGAYIDNVTFEASPFLNTYTAVSDSFTDGGRNNGGDALDLTWVGTNLTLTVSDDAVIGSGKALCLTNGIKDPCMVIGHTFWSAVLANQVGDRVRFSCDLRFNTINPTGSSQIRVGLYKRANSDPLYDTNAVPTYNDNGYFWGLNLYTNRGSYINAEPASGTNYNALGGGNGVYGLSSIPGSGAIVFVGFNDITNKHSVVLDVVRWGQGENGPIRLYGYVDGVLVSAYKDDTPLARAFDEIAIRFQYSLSNVYQNVTVDNVVLQSIKKGLLLIIQ